MTEEETYRLLVQQRIRNRIIEYFGIVVEFESDPGAMSFNGLVNQWEMYVDHPFTSSEYPAPAFTDKEVSALQRVDAAWEAFCEATPAHISHERSTFQLPSWSALVSEAKSALLVFGERGKLPEEVLV